jgi:hypothetical protein
MFNHQHLIYRSIRWFLKRLLPKKSYLLITTSLFQLLGRSDIKRWTKRENLYANWEERTKLMAQWIPDESSVIEFGCGNMLLKKYMPQKAQYTPSDLVRRDKDTVVLDLNQKSPLELLRHNVFFFSGVLEYVYDVERLIQVSSQVCDLFIFSYVTCEIKTVSVLAQRRSEGWVNDYSKEEILILLQDKGFKLIEEKTWGNQLLFCFRCPDLNQP